jgi:hypothetical protein
MSRLKDHMLDIDALCEECIEEGFDYEQFIAVIRTTYPNDSMSQDYAESVWKQTLQNI